MYRFFCRQRRILRFSFVGFVISFLIILISDDHDYEDHVHTNVQMQNPRNFFGSSERESNQKNKTKKVLQTLELHDNPKELVLRMPMDDFKGFPINSDKVNAPMDFEESVAHGGQSVNEIKRKDSLRRNRNAQNDRVTGEAMDFDNHLALGQQGSNKMRRRKGLLPMVITQKNKANSMPISASVDKVVASVEQNRTKTRKSLLQSPYYAQKQQHMGPSVVIEKQEDMAQGWIPPPNLGEGGVAVKVDEGRLSDQQQRQMKEAQKRYSFNEFVSSLISLHRSMPDSRHPECLTQQFPANLPDVSVVIIFHNEAWSTLLRTVHSVLDRSPSHLLRQVILVDDFSSLGHLQAPLDRYVSELPKVQLVRSPSRQGLIVARLLGFEHVTASTVVFLDSHCECADGWLEPLLDRIARDPTTVVVPVILAIDKHTFEVNHPDLKHLSVGTFRWELAFRWMSIPQHERRRRKSDIDPVRSPTMAGGLFAIDTNYFKKLGTYDPEMKIWGGENLELSFKVWMCGGTLEMVPCSHVGHVFRSSFPYSTGGFKNSLSTNLARLAAVWLDEYSYYYHQAEFSEPKDINISDVSERVELRRRLKCHSFAWYLMHVLPERFLPADRIAHGPIKNELLNLCLYQPRKSASDRLALTVCTEYNNWRMNLGEWAVFRGNEIFDTFCLDYSGKDWIDVPICHGAGGNQLWRYSKDLKQLYHVTSGKCLAVSTANHSSPQAIMSFCDSSNPRQHWLWDTSPLPGPSWRKDLAAGRSID